MNPPKGWKLVPIEPTSEMCEVNFRTAEKIYAALIAVAPTPQ